MRTLLIKTAIPLIAMCGVALAGASFAQTPAMPFQPSQGMMVGPSAPNAIANSSNNATGGVVHFAPDRAAADKRRPSEKVETDRAKE
jgi:hypothetical protein